MSSDDGSTKLGSKSWVPMGAAISAAIFLIGLAVGGTGWAAHMGDLVTTLVEHDTARDQREKDNQKAMADLAAVIAKLGGSVDRFTELLDHKVDAADFRVWIANFARLNPSSQVPDFGGVFDGSGPRK